jgi:hypothetical protein
VKTQPSSDQSTPTPDRVDRALSDAVASIRAHVEHGTLSDDRLSDLLGWIESGEFPVDGQSVKLFFVQKQSLKELAASAIVAVKGGAFERGACRWVSGDGKNLKLEMR